MLLTITTTYQPATDLGYLLHKRPDRVQSFSLNFGQATVFYSEASAQRCTAALLLEVDSIHLIRGHSSSMDQYVNDRPYVSSSFLSVAIAEVFGTALNGRCAGKPELAETQLPLQARLAVLPCRGGEGFLKRLFEPLGYTITAIPHMLDEQHPEWGMSPYFTVTLDAICRLSDLLTHLYVLIPVLDNDKHYWIGDAEVEKLLRHGKGWLENHPEREQIASRYLKHKRDLTQDAIARLVAEDTPDQETAEAIPVVEEEVVLPDRLSEARTQLGKGAYVGAERSGAGKGVYVAAERSGADITSGVGDIASGVGVGGLHREIVEKHLTLHQQRLGAVMAVLSNSGARRVLDLG